MQYGIYLTVDADRYDSNTRLNTKSAGISGRGIYSFKQNLKQPSSHKRVVSVDFSRHETRVSVTPYIFCSCTNHGLIYRQIHKGEIFVQALL